MAASSRRRSPTRSATRCGCRPSRSARSPRPTTPTRSSPPAAPIFAPWRVRIWPIRPSSCTRPPRSAMPSRSGRSNIYSARGQYISNLARRRCSDGQMSMAKRHALVTGAGSGIGARHRACARRGRPSRQPVRPAGGAAGIRPRRDQAAGGEAFVVDGFDVTDARSVADKVAEAVRQAGEIAVLVNCAGEAPSTPFEKTDLALWSRVIGINLTGTFLVTQAALPSVKRAGNGRIINIASTAGLTGYAYVSAYCASKHGVIGLTRALALETARTDVTVNAVCPGFTDTPLLAGAVDTISGKTGRSRGRGAGEPGARQSARPAGDAAGGGGHGAVAGFGKGDRHHRPGDRRSPAARSWEADGNDQSDAGQEASVQGSQARAFPVRDRCRRPRRDDHAQPARQEEPAHLPELRGAARTCSGRSARPATCAPSC